MFGGRKLNNGWKLLSAKIQESPPYPRANPYFSKIPTTGTDDASFTIRMSLPDIVTGPLAPDPGPLFNHSTGEANVIIEEIIIEGPSPDWRNAFKK